MKINNMIVKRILTATFAIMPLPLYAASLNPTLDDRVSIRGGPFFASIDSKLRIQDQEFDVEDRLDADKTTVAIALDWRITSRLILNAGFSELSRDEALTASAPIPVGGVSVPAGSNAKIDFTTRNFDASLGYSFVRNNTTELGARLGLKVLTIEDKVTFNLPGAPSVILVDDDTTQPLPTLGAYVNHAFSPKWLLTGRFGYFNFAVGDIDGKITDLFGSVEYRPWQSVGVGLGYIFTDADVKVTDQDVTATNVEYEYKGPFAYLLFGFGSVR